MKIVRGLLFAASLFGIGAAYAGGGIIAAGGTTTELLYNLGAGDDIVAVDVTSRFPVEIQALPKIGYHRALSAEGLLALQPKTLIGTDEMGPPEVLKQLAAAGVQVETLSTDASFENLGERISKLSSLLGQEKKGLEMWEAIQHEAEEAGEIAAGHKPVRALFLMAHTGTPVVAGGNSTANTLIEMAGAVNPAAEAFDGFRSVSGESLLAMAPDVILVSNYTREQKKGLDDLFDLQPGLKATPAGRNGKIVTIDGSVIVSGLGPRVGLVAKQLAQDLYLHTP